MTDGREAQQGHAGRPTVEAEPRSAAASEAGSEAEAVDPYTEGYWERGEGSNYHGYGDDPGWELSALALRLCAPDATRLLEIGAARGFFLQAAERARFTVDGIDTSAYATTTAARRVLHGDVSTIDPGVFPPAGYDIVCSWEVLEHIPEAALPGVWERIQTWSAPSALQVHRIAAEDDTSDSTHVTLRPLKWWEKQLRLHFDGHRRGDVEDVFNGLFAGRDWAGRFLAWQNP